MREFKDGKLKTTNGEVVTDKKQALANILPPKGCIDNIDLYIVITQYIRVAGF